MVCRFARDLTVASAALAAFSLSVSASAQTIARPPAEEVDITTPARDDINFAVTGGLEYQMETDLDEPGDFSVIRFSTGFGVQRSFNDDFRASLNLSYGIDLYDFDEGVLGVDAGEEPWDDIHTLNIRLLLSYDIDERWTIFGGPMFQSARESGADFDDSIILGGGLGATYRWSDDLTIGGGLVVAGELESGVRLSPIIVVDWRFADDFSLRSQTGNLGNRNGLELVWMPERPWELAVGIASQHSRFRLADDGPSGGGVGEDQSMPIWFRATYNASKQLRLDGIVGLNTSGELWLEDPDGETIGNVDYDAAIFFGVFGSYRF